MSLLMFHQGNVPIMKIGPIENKGVWVPTYSTGTWQTGGRFRFSYPVTSNITIHFNTLNGRSWKVYVYIGQTESTSISGWTESDNIHSISSAYCTPNMDDNYIYSAM